MGFFLNVSLINNLTFLLFSVMVARGRGRAQSRRGQRKTATSGKIKGRGIKIKRRGLVRK